jgi:hypothetical protein
MLLHLTHAQNQDFQDFGEPCALKTKNDCNGEDQQQFTRPTN